MKKNTKKRLDAALPPAPSGKEYGFTKKEIEEAKRRRLWEPLRHVRLEGGYTLRTWDTNEREPGRFGKSRIGYEFRDPTGRILFKGDDYFVPGVVDDDESLRGLLGFLTLRPGDTDAEYFDGYTDSQMAFAESSDAEYLSMYAHEVDEGERMSFEEIED